MDDLTDRLADALRPWKGLLDYGAIRWEEGERLILDQRPGEPLAVQWQAFGRGSVQIARGGAWIFASFAHLDRLASVLEATIHQGTGGGRSGAMALISHQDRILLPPENDPRNLPLGKKQALIATYTEQLQTGPGDWRSPHLTWTETVQRHYLVNHVGTAIVQESSRIALRGETHLHEGGRSYRMATCHHSRRGGAPLQDLTSQWARLQQQTGDLARAQPAPPKPQTLILDGHLAGVLLHEAFGHLAEGDFLPGDRPLLPLGSRLTACDLTVQDDPTLPDLWGSYTYDDEGTPAQPVTLIAGGIWQHQLHHHASAIRWGGRSTGHGRALTAAHPPLVRMSNTLIAPGPEEDLWGDLAEGIYLQGCRGGQTNGEQFTFTPALAYRIRRGAIAEPLQPFTLKGNIFQTLQRLEGVGAGQMILGGNCGKQGQSPLPVTVGGAAIRLGPDLG